MKTYLIIFISVIMFSCNHSDCNNGIQDGNETGIDCGGGCPNCLPIIIENTDINEEMVYNDSIFNNNDTFQKLQGLWYTNYNLIRTYNSNNDTTHVTMHVYKDTDIKTSFSDVIEPNSLFYFLTSKGIIYTPEYPNSYVYSYDSIFNRITFNNNYDFNILSISDDSLNLDFVGNTPSIFEYYLSHDKTIFSTSTTIDWEVNLLNFYPNNNEIKIKIEYTAGITVVRDTINSTITYFTNFKSKISWNNTSFQSSYSPREISNASMPTTTILFN